MKREPFSRKATAGLITAFSISFTAFVLWSVFGADLATQEAWGADSYSKSALGHHALVQLLRELDIPVVTSRHASAAKAGEDSLLVLIEPRLDMHFAEQSEERIRAMRDAAKKVLLVLPKWEGLQHWFRSGWVGEVRRMDLEDVTAVLDAGAGDGEVVAPEPGDWDTGEFGIIPTIDGPNLMRSLEMDALIRCDGGILLGSYGRFHRLYVLSDPDILSTHGLGRGRNAALAATIITKIRGDGDGAVIIDETLHGYDREPSTYRALFEFPLGLATFQILLCTGLLLWAAMGRFGAPLPEPPAIAPGKEFLIDNIASLLRYGGHAAHALPRYLNAAMAEASRRLHAPPDLQGEERIQWLDRIAAARGIEVRIADLKHSVRDVTRLKRGREYAIVALAHQIHLWREEIIHGSGEHPRS